LSLSRLCVSQPDIFCAFAILATSCEFSSFQNRPTLQLNSRVLCFDVSDADKDDTGKYKVEVSNESGTGTCEIPVKVKGRLIMYLLTAAFVTGPP